MVEQFDVSTDGTMIAFSVSSPITPGDLFIKNVDTGEENQLTHFNKDFETSHAFSIPDELEFTGTDGLSIQGWYFKPKDFNPQKTYPAVVEITLFGMNFKYCVQEDILSSSVIREVQPDMVPDFKN